MNQGESIMRRFSFSSTLLAAVTILAAGCGAKIKGDAEPVKATPKDSKHVNFVQCSNSSKEVLFDATRSDLENQILENGDVSIRDVEPVGSPYYTVRTNQMTVTIWGTMDDPA